MSKKKKRKQSRKIYGIIEVVNVTTHKITHLDYGNLNDNTTILQGSDKEHQRLDVSG
tara:strand:- start:53 stop:223 length:171 start_codon:yes stop_codon:yes gene_type:complete